jgi:hypothetical protein
MTTGIPAGLSRLVRHPPAHSAPSDSSGTVPSPSGLNCTPDSCGRGLQNRGSRNGSLPAELTVTYDMHARRPRCLLVGSLSDTHRAATQQGRWPAVM